MLIKAINEKTSAKYTATLKDETNAVVPGASLSTLTLTLYDVDTDTIINSRNAQNVLNAANVTVDGAGLLTWLIQPSDTAIVTPTTAVEYHVAVFTATWATGEATWAITLAVANLSHLS